VLPGLERFGKADLPEVKAQGARLVQEYSAKVMAARLERQKAEERQKRAAACKPIANEAVRLAQAYDYIPARAKFSEAFLAYRLESCEPEAETVRKLGEDYQKEYALLNKLVDYADAGGLSSARVKLADGLVADVVSLDSEKLTYTRGMDKRAALPWREVPAASVFALLRRVKLSGEERAALAGFALRRGLYAEAKEELDKLLAAEPERKAELAPLLDAAEKGLQALAPKPPEEKKPEGEKKPEEKKD
jgi:hypothetical protein